MKVGVKKRVPGLPVGEDCTILQSLGLPYFWRITNVWRTTRQTDTPPLMAKSRSNIAERDKNVTALGQKSRDELITIANSFLCF